MITSILILLFANSCKKFIEVPAPTTSLTEASVFNNDQTAISVVTGLFAKISDGSGAYYSTGMTLGILSMPKLTGLSADELDLWSGATLQERGYYENDLQSHFNGGASSVEAGAEFWNWLYPLVYSTNQTLENLESASSLTPRIRQQLLGECRVYRAFLYFYLVNLYGDVPLVLDASPETNRKLKRAPKAEVYTQIIADLTEAKRLLNPDYVNGVLQPYGTGTAERIRPNRWAATALLARVWLYTGEDTKAAQMADEVINQNALFDLSDVTLNDVFKKNSREAIWQLQPVYFEFNTPESRMFNLGAEPVGFNNDKTVYLSQSLLEAFEAGDARHSIWIEKYNSIDPAGDFYFPSKYVDAAQNPNITPESGGAFMTEYSMVLRLAEQYLIRAEARANTGDLTGAIADLNILRTRARAEPTAQIPNPLPNLRANLNQVQVLQAVAQERRVELFSEWGHRWLDLKRSRQVNAVMEQVTPNKGGTWQTGDALYPLPASDLHYAPQLTQNPGY